MLLSLFYAYRFTVKYKEYVGKSSRIPFMTLLLVAAIFRSLIALRISVSLLLISEPRFI